MGKADKVKETLTDLAGGVRGTRGTDEEERDDGQPAEGFEPQESRAQKKPGDNLPKPETAE